MCVNVCLQGRTGEPGLDVSVFNEKIIFTGLISFFTFIFNLHPVISKVLMPLFFHVQGFPGMMGDKGDRGERGEKVGTQQQ